MLGLLPDPRPEGGRRARRGVSAMFHPSWSPVEALPRNSAEVFPPQGGRQPPLQGDRGGQWNRGSEEKRCEAPERVRGSSGAALALSDFEEYARACVSARPRQKDSSGRGRSSTRSSSTCCTTSSTSGRESPRSAHRASRRAKAPTRSTSDARGRAAIPLVEPTGRPRGRIYHRPRSALAQSAARTSAFGRVRLDSPREIRD